MKSSPNLCLRQLLHEAQWTMEQLARTVNELASYEGFTLRYDRTSVAHWLSGTTPRDPAPALIATALSTRLKRTVTLTDVGYAPTTAAPTAQDLFSSAVTACTRPPAHAPPLAPLNPLPARLQRDGHSLPSPHDDTAAFFIRQHYRYGGHGHTALVTYINREVRPDHTSTPLTSTAKLTYALGLLVADRGDHRLADTLWGHSARLARHVEQPDLQAIALRARAIQAHRRGKHLTALALITKARQLAEDGAVRIYTLVQHASTLAAIGQTDTALSLLRTAENHYEPRTDSSDTFTVYPQAGFLFQHAHVLTACGRHAEAADSLRRSLDLRPPTELRNRALTHAALAQLLLPIAASQAAEHIEEMSVLQAHISSHALDTAIADLRRRHHGRLAARG